MFACDMLQEDHGHRGHYEMTCARWLTFTHLSTIGGEYVTVEAALVNCIVPDPLQPTMHPHDSALCDCVL